MARMKKKHTQETNGRKCPNCGAPLKKDTAFCYKCSSFLTDDGSELLSPEKVTDEEIQRLLDQSQEAKKKMDATTRGKISTFTSRMAVLFFILIMLFVLFDSTKYELICVGALAVCILLTAIISPRDLEEKLDSKEIEDIITKYVAAVECRRVYGDETRFEPESALPEDLILSAAFYSQGYSKYQGNRLIQGSFKGYPFISGHVKLMRFHTHNGHKNTINIFDGYCMSIDTDLVVPDKIRIAGKYLGCLTQVLNEDKEESALFDEVFSVKCDQKEAAEQFLTPELRKNIILMSREYPGDLSIVLSPGGNLFIAAGGGEDAFAENLPAEKIREKYRKELEYPLKVLECFLD